MRRLGNLVKKYATLLSMQYKSPYSFILKAHVQPKKILRAALNFAPTENPKITQLYQNNTSMQCLLGEHRPLKHTYFNFGEQPCSRHSPADISHYISFSLNLLPIAGRVTSSTRDNLNRSR